ncbi:endonuclease/exonuclease/phosphatase family protein [Oricola cellulosilytica]|uniref:Endonuclease/exonuclease/phosphatase family protein n=1 Tax=Oricola cellulosilytica TaxID=1429082 RepID=A0A4R0P831_9HYPH|nr:endonuclease/exonuclease/phosphatase family protein [Oricola cellulosilytica]TCD13191.1 endonuclease/exonuclease/phosphatase family protein [Oricola cellulosilytica]
MRIATFNVQNLRLLREDGHVAMHGARDMDVPDDGRPSSAALDMLDRRLTAEIIALANADVIALQEVFDRASLDYFHDRFLVPTGTAPYPHRICLPGNDGRGFDVALMSRLPPSDIRSHAATTARDLKLEPASGRSADEPVFRRDCLEASIGGLTLFICHFKAPYPDAADAWETRRLEALAVRRIIEQRFPHPANAYWMILGDLNEPRTEVADERAIAPLLEHFAIDLVERVPAGRRWSHHMASAGIYSRPDALLASPALARLNPEAEPAYFRQGLPHVATRFTGKRLSEVGVDRPHASDHAALAVELSLPNG